MHGHACNEQKSHACLSVLRVSVKAMVYYWKEVKKPNRREQQDCANRQFPEIDKENANVITDTQPILKTRNGSVCPTFALR